MHEQIVTNGISMHLVSEGPTDGTPVIMLHGFPEFWWSWRKQIDPLARRGYRVLVPDQRGYNQSDKPKSIRAYRIETLAQDVIGLIDRSGVQKARIVGHDWGAMVAWWLGMRHPDRVEKIAALNVPHPLVYGNYMFESVRQLERSWYTIFFQLPYFPERAAFLKGDGAGMAGAMRKTSRPGTFSSEDLAQYRAAWRQPGAPTAMLNWYRAAIDFPLLRFSKENMRVGVPLMLIWGTKDTALCEEMADMSVSLCDRGRLERIVTASHWVHHEEPERVTELLLDFLA